MFWIDKHNKRKRRRGHQIVNAFLREAWSSYDKKYVNCTYASFKRNRRMEDLLYDEQGGFCCYCMRHLDRYAHTSLEHVMPHNSVDKQNRADYKKINYYKRFNKTFNRYVYYIHLNGSKRRWHVGVPYPHFCAYENLVLSCDGSLFTDEDNARNCHPSKIHLCCNESRGNSRIVPLFFIPGIGDLIIYHRDGTIGISKVLTSPEQQKAFSESIDCLKLEHERLQIIRQVWFYIAASGLYNADHVKAAADDEVLRQEIMMDSGIPGRLAKRIKHPIYWSLLCDYFWFYSYFKNRL